VKFSEALNHYLRLRDWVKGEVSNEAQDKLNKAASVLDSFFDQLKPAASEEDQWWPTGKVARDPTSGGWMIEEYDKSTGKVRTTIVEIIQAVHK
jgi:hypothetical protein